MFGKKKAKKVYVPNHHDTGYLARLEKAIVEAERREDLSKKRRKILQAKRSQKLQSL